jgi:hypothetical protein
LAKIGRNDFCPCGSKIKYKKCCERKHAAIAAAKQKFLAMETAEANRRRIFGEVRPQIATRFYGKKIVAVGDRIYRVESEDTFVDFLDKFIKTEFGLHWWNGECQKPEKDRHPLIRLAFLKHQHFLMNSKKDGNFFTTEVDGPTKEFLSVAYDLYVLRHHSVLQKKLIKKMKIPNTYHSFRYEAYVAAVMIKAGFEIEYEDETDGTSRHPEFTATHKKSGIKCSVEAKQRNRQLPITLEDWKDGAKVKLGITHLIRDAVGKDQGIPFILFVDIGAPPIEGNPFEKPWSKEILDSPSSSGARNQDGKDLFNVVVFTNRPAEYTVGRKPQTTEVVSISQFPLRPLPEAILLDIRRAISLHGNIPSNFEE